MPESMHHVGEIIEGLPVVKKAAAKRAPLTLSQVKMLDAATAIRLDPEKVERAYMARQLVQCTLPHRNPGNVPAWTRRNGNVTLGIQPGWNHQKGCSFGYPYGSLPRLLLFWVTTEAVLTKNRRLELGQSLAAFMRELSLDPSRGGSRSDAKRLRSQMERLFRCRISFDQLRSRDDGAQGTPWLDMQVAPKGELWWDPKTPEQGALWGSWIELGEDFFKAIIAAPVPHDMRALRALKQSPLALDLYALLNYRGFTTKEPQYIGWQMLTQQLGSDVGGMDNFRRKVLAALRKVLAVQPHLKVTQEKGGIRIYPSRPAIAPRAAKQ